MTRVTRLPLQTFEDIERALQAMQPQHRLFQLVKHEMEARGHWKQKPRGEGFKKGSDPRRGAINPDTIDTESLGANEGLVIHEVASGKTPETPDEVLRTSLSPRMREFLERQTQDTDTV